MRESRVEKRLTEKVKAAGGWALKFVSPGCSGVPDRLVLMPDGRLWFVEVKAPGQTLRPLQQHRVTRLRHLGFQVRVLDSLEAVEEFAREVMPYEI